MIFSEFNKFSKLTTKEDKLMFLLFFKVFSYSEGAIHK